jgi:hypothetical protein
MTNGMLNILLADDDEADRILFRRCLQKAGLPFACTETVTLEDAIRACGNRHFDCAVLDYRMPGYDGLEGIAILHQRYPHLPIVMLTGRGDEVVATEAMKRGATDYIPKRRMEPELTRRVIEGAIQSAALRRKVAQEQEELRHFAAGLVQDLKTPIQAVTTFASFLSQDVKDAPLDEELRERLDGHCAAVVAASRRLNALIDALHGYTKADAGANFDSVNMNRVLGEAIDALKPLIEQRQAKVTSDDLPTAFGNAAQLELLLEQLIDNAIKYCDAPAPSVHVTARRHKSAWVFAVNDNGVGVPEGHRRQVFEPFRRSPDAVRYEGAGLGLATCRRIVERHGGAIWCEGRPEGGSTFLFSLPTFLEQLVRH